MPLMSRYPALLALACIAVQSMHIQVSDGLSQRKDDLQTVLDSDLEPIKLMESAKPRAAKAVPQDRRNKWTVSCDSEDSAHPCSHAIDGNKRTYWSTKPKQGNAGFDDPLPHSIVLDLNHVEVVTALSMKAKRGGVREDAVSTITTHKVFISMDNLTWGAPVAFGTWYNDTEDVKFATFQHKEGRYVRLEAVAASGDSSVVKVQNLDVWVVDVLPEPSAGLGRWGPTIDFPLVAVGAFVDPASGNVITFSSFTHDGWSQQFPEHSTFTSVWNPTTGEVTQRQVRNNNHDMFCPGMTYDVDGRMIITGGTSAKKVSIYVPEKDDWIPAAELEIARGYHGQAMCSDGRIFTIGGSWAPDGNPWGHRTGEIYDPAHNDSGWNTLEGCPAETIQTSSEWKQDQNKRAPEYRSDNHVWLMGWKNRSIFHAGPSKAMHWIDTTKNGSYHEAGPRGSGNDAMCGNAVMFNATEGKILAVGGAPQYDYYPAVSNPFREDWKLVGKEATTDAFIIELDEVYAKPKVRPAGGGMKLQRIFHNSVVLPNGDVFVVGGMKRGQFFNESTAHTVPELYSAAKDTWTLMASHVTPRVYHSVALLLPDATVLSAGSGLCANCSVNRFDGQIYTPQYLLTPEGLPAERPNILELSGDRFDPGNSFSFRTNSKITVASLVRYGGATHALNNDQRRIELVIKMLETDTRFEVTLPADGGIAIPGPYMLFVMNESGVPSVARTIYIRIAK